MKYFKTIKFKLYDDPLMDRIRQAARKESWTTVAGFKDWAKETYNATLRSGKWGDVTSISFYHTDDYERFKQSFGIE